MSIQDGLPCPRCSNDLHFVDKPTRLKDWGLVCICGHHFGPGSAWGHTSEEAHERYREHCLKLGWGWDETLEDYPDGEYMTTYLTGERLIKVLREQLAETQRMVDSYRYRFREMCELLDDVSDHVPGVSEYLFERSRKYVDNLHGGGS